MHQNAPQAMQTPPAGGGKPLPHVPPVQLNRKNELATTPIAPTSFLFDNPATMPVTYKCQDMMGTLV